MVMNYLSVIYFNSTWILTGTRPERANPTKGDFARQRIDSHMDLGNVSLQRTRIGPPDGLLQSECEGVQFLDWRVVDCLQIRQKFHVPQSGAAL